MWRTAATRKLALAATVVSLGGCTFTVPPDLTTFEPGVEHIPAPGYVEITGDPQSAPEDLTIQYASQDGAISAQTDRIMSGGQIKGGAVDLPGALHLIVNDEVCDGSIPIISGSVTAVILRLLPSRCETVVTGIWPVPGG
jgi:hypothetical protein